MKYMGIRCLQVLGFNVTEFAAVEGEVEWS
jgi:hypothetical protein